MKTRHHTSARPPKCGRAAILSFLACVFLSSAWADQVVLKNGDRVTGTIVKKDEKNLTIKTDQLGEVTVPWDQITSVSTSEPINVVLQDGRTAQGTLSTSNGRVEVAAPNARLNVGLADISTLRNADEQRAYDRLQHPGWTDLWAGNASLGLAGVTGNASTLTFTGALKAARETKTDKTSIYFNAIKASALVNGANEDTAQAVRGGIAYNRNISPRVFASAFNDWEYDKFQDLDLRFVVGGGVGFHALKTERSTLDLLAGADYNHSRFSTPLTRNSAEIYWGDDYTFKMNSATSLLQSFRMFNDLTNTGDYRVNFDIGASTKVSKWLNWDLSLSDRYLNDPAPGRKTNDFLYSTGIGISFSR